MNNETTIGMLPGLSRLEREKAWRDALRFAHGAWSDGTASGGLWFNVEVDEQDDGTCTVKASWRPDGPLRTIATFRGEDKPAHYQMSAHVLTDAQNESLQRLRQRHARIGKPVELMGGDGCVMVEVFATTHAELPMFVIGIEEDGHAHS